VYGLPGCGGGMGQALGVLRLLIPKLLSLRAWAMFLGLLGAGILSSRCQGVCGPRMLMRAHMYC
jgi:hypothetical protein